MAKRKRPLNQNTANPNPPKRQRTTTYHKNDTKFFHPRFHFPYFPFHLLPPELRHKIYTLLFQSSKPIKPHYPLETNDSLSLFTRGRRRRRRQSEEELRYPIRKLAPLVLDKKTYTEAIQVLYGSNTFYFKTPWTFLFFASRIGAANRALVRSLSIYMRIPAGGDAAIPDPGLPLSLSLKELSVMTTELVEVSDEGRNVRVSGRTRATRNSVPAYWAGALAVCALNGVTRLEVQAPHWPVEVHAMPAEVRDGVVGVLERGCAGGIVPHVELKGFTAESGEVWPEGWGVVMSEWPKLDAYWKLEAGRLDYLEALGMYPCVQMPLPDSSDEDL